MKYNTNPPVFLTWYQSHRSDFFFLGSSVFIGIILDSQLLPPLQLLLQPFAVKPLTCFSHHLWFRTYSSRHLESWDHCQIVAAVILASIVFLQVPLRSSSADLPSCGNLTIIGAPTRPHASPKYSAQNPTNSMRQVSPVDVSLRWCHHCHVICWRHSPVNWRHRWPDHWPALTSTYGWLWPLTFC